jgi:hypothetical protein
MKSFFKTKLRCIKKILTNPYTSLVIGFILLLCGILESVETMFEDIIGIEIGAHHGVIIFAVAQIMLAFVHILDGIEDICVAEIVEEVGEMEEDFIEKSNVDK